MSDPDFSELESEFGEVMAMLRDGPLDQPLESPGEDVWKSIVTGLGDDLETISVEPDGDDEVDLDGQAAPSSGAPVISLADRRGWGRPAAMFTAVAAAILLIGVPVGLALRSSGPDQTAELAALPGFDGFSGRAEVTDRTMEVDLDGLQVQEGAFYELWLLDLDGAEVRALHSLGKVDADGSFVVPDDIDLEQFSVVDVSIEPDDGNPDHSGESVLRGGLEGS